MGEQSSFYRAVLFMTAILMGALNVSCQSDSEFKREKRTVKNRKESQLHDESYESLSPIDKKLCDADLACDNKDFAKARELLSSLKGLELSIEQHFYSNNILNLIKRGEAIAEYDRNMHPTVKEAEREYDSGNYNKAKQLLNSVNLNELSDSDRRWRDNLLEMIRSYQ